MDQGEFPLSDREFARIKERVYRVAGISLSEAKRTLVVSRLGKILRRKGVASFSDYVDFLERGATDAEEQEFVNALTTNLTRFYREDHHFDHLVGYVGELVAARPRTSPTGKPRLRIWSAGCSTGQEPYTIAMSLVAKYPELKRWDFRILATDIDTAVLEKAERGVYPEAELAGLDPQRTGMFERVGNGAVMVPPAIRALVAFKPLNLNQEWPMKGPFDAIFCRNVAIYFDKPTQTQLFTRLSDMMAPNGFLYIGHSESIAAGVGAFSLVGKTIYQNKPTMKSRDAA